MNHMNALISFYRNISIKTKLIIILIILIIYPIIIIGYIGYQNYAQTMKQKVITYSQQSVNELSRLLSERIEKLNISSHEILYDQSIDVFNKQLTAQIKNNSLSEYRFKEGFERYLKSILFSKPEVTTVLFHFAVNKKIYMVNKNFQPVSSSSFPIEEMYVKARTSKGKPVWFFDHQGDEIESTYLVKIIYDIHSLKEIGMLVYKIDQEYLFGAFKDFIESKKQNVYIFTSNNIELIHFNSFEPHYEKFSLNKIISTNNTGIYEISLKKDNIYVIYETIPPLNWKLVVSISSNILLEEVRFISKKVVMLCLITLPLWIIVINLLYVEIVKPMNGLINTMRKVEKGNIGATITYNRNDELGYVFNNFNKMSLEIHHLINRVYKEQIALKDAEIKALQAQINPHFLYNTLETINWKAKLSGVEEISEMIEALSSISDANLNRSGENEIPLSQEIQYIDNYHLLIQKRFGHKIRFTKYIQPECLNCTIPKLIIQPLIENAIYHGLERKKGGGIIELIIEIKEHTLFITVSDNGLGIQSHILENIKYNLLTSDTHTIQNCDSSTSIGIINVQKRIQLLYGQEYGLDISSEYGSGTVVTLTLPVQLH